MNFTHKQKGVILRAVADWKKGKLDDEQLIALLFTVDYTVD